MIYKAVRTTTEENYCKEHQICYDANLKHLQEVEKAAIEAGGLLHRFLYESVADGKAIYQIIKVNKKTVRVRLIDPLDGLYDDYVVPQWGLEATISIEYAERAIHWQDYWRNLKKD